MLSSRVCSRCASQLRTARQPVAKLAFSSAADTKPDAQTQSSQSTGTRGERPSQRHNGTQKSRGGGGGRRRPSGSAYDIFNQMVNTQGSHWTNKPVAAGSSDVSAVASNGPSEIDLTFKLTNLVKRRKEPVKKRLEVFNETIWPQLQAYGANVPSHLSDMARSFVDGACKDAAKHGHANVSLELVRIAANIGYNSPRIPNTMALTVCHALVSDKNNSSYRKFMSQQLVQIWMHVSQMQRLNEKGQPLRFALRDAVEFRTALQRDQHIEDDSYNNVSVKAIDFLGGLFPQFDKKEVKQLAGGLLATISVLSDPRYVPQRTQREAAPLLELVGIYFSKYSADSEKMLQAFFNSPAEPKSDLPADKSRELAEYIKNQQPVVLRFLTEEDQTWRLGNTGNKATANLAGVHKRLRAAYQSRNRNAVKAIWMEMYDQQAKSTDMRKALQARPELMDFWVFVLCAMRLNQEFKNTVDMMAELRIGLTLRTYTSMMHGWRLCKDITKLDKLWDKLIEANVKLDGPIWTERLSAYIVKGQAQQCIQALASLQATWQAAVASGTASESGAVQPSIEMVNTSVKGLLDIDPQAAESLLEWAHNNGIRANIHTYNIVLRKAFSTGTDDVAWVLDRMSRDGIEPDQATFVILTEEVLQMTGQDSPEQQVAAVDQVFADLSRTKMALNAEMYAKVLYSVASLADASDAAVDAVLEHLRHLRVPINPYMVTILIERALARDPTSFAPVEALLREHGMDNLARGDQTMWERVVAAAAVTGRPAEALDLFDRLAAAGRPVTSLPCLKELLMALVAAGDDKGARRVVGSVLAAKTAAHAQLGGGSDMHDARFWRHHFWFVALENGLLDAEAVPAGLRELIRSQRPQLLNALHH